MRRHDKKEREKSVFFFDQQTPQKEDISQKRSCYSCYQKYMNTIKNSQYIKGATNTQKNKHSNVVVVNIKAKLLESI